jgi:hypothetical protein
MWHFTEYIIAIFLQSDYRESEMKKIDWHDYKKMAEDKEMIGMVYYHILQ